MASFVLMRISTGHGEVNGAHVVDVVHVRGHVPSPLLRAPIGVRTEPSGFVEPKPNGLLDAARDGARQFVDRALFERTVVSKK